MIKKKQIILILILEKKIIKKHIFQRSNNKHKLIKALKTKAQTSKSQLKKLYK